MSRVGLGSGGMSSTQRGNQKTIAVSIVRNKMKGNRLNKQCRKKKEERGIGTTQRVHVMEKKKEMKQRSLNKSATIMANRVPQRGMKPFLKEDKAIGKEERKSDGGKSAGGRGVVEGEKMGITNFQTYCHLELVFIELG